IMGTDFNNVKKELNTNYIPNKIVLGGEKSELPLLKDKESAETKIYVCKNKTCQLPVATVAEAVKNIRGL
ncbi:MAG: hypothetical protein EOO91_21330, partial [Pedobacter sp.]